MYDTVSDSCVNSMANWYAQISKTAKHSMAIAMLVTSDADKEYVLPLHMPFKKDTGELSEMGVPFFLHIKYELCSLRAYAIIVSRNWKLVD